MSRRNTIAARTAPPVAAQRPQFGWAVCFLVAASTVAAAQGWEPTVTTGSLGSREPLVLKPAILEKYRAAQAAPAVPAPAPPSEEKVASTRPPAPVRKEGAPPSEYCVNIVDAAADARVAWQRKVLLGVGEEIDKRIALLEEKTAEFKKWLARRDEFTQKANETVLKIYSRMRPDAAAQQLVALDLETAAAVLTKLEPRLASLILNDMDAGHAAKLTSTIVGSGKVYPAPARSAKVEAEK